MKRTFNLARIFAAIATAMTLVACGGGGGSGSVSTGGVYYSHEELAAEFVRRVNVDVSGYNLTLVKSNTYQTDYIVVFDSYYGTYDAYYLGNYSVGNNLYNYLSNYDSYFYYNLIPNGGNVYEDPYTGTLFEKQEASGKDLGKMQALQQEVAIEKKAEQLQATYGLSKDKAVDTARFAYNVKTAPAGTYNAKDFDAFAKQMTGSTITEFQNDYKNDKISFAQRLVKAGEVSGLGAAGVAGFVNEAVLGKN